jgi:hypothetical protein
MATDIVFNFSTLELFHQEKRTLVDDFSGVKD